MFNFMFVVYVIVVKLLMYIVDKIYYIIDLKMSGQVGIMFLFWKWIYENCCL